ncbi:MAG: superoxide dismutase [Bacteroidales bacterium]
MNKRTFLKTSLMGLGGIFAAPVISGTVYASDGNSSDRTYNQEGKFTLPSLPYDYDALEPHIDARTMEIHHSRHHAGYVNNLNNALQGLGGSDKSLEDIMKSVSSYSEAIRNNGGGHYNHQLFWEVMGPKGEGQPSGELLSAINSTFGSFGKFKEQFSSAASTRFGSGWAWLLVRDGKLKISSTPNQDNPLMDVVDERGTPILGLDVWEHAYYLKYQNMRGDYISAFWEVVNWDAVSEKLKKA